MRSHRTDQHLQMEITCGSLLSELQKIWDEVGEVDKERDKMLFELEQECLDAYRRKVDQANRCRAQLRQAVADAEAQLADFCAALGERPVHIKKSSGSLKKELQEIMPELEDMKKKRNERKGQFAEVLKQINSISTELAGSTEENLNTIVIDESDLSMKRLDDLRSERLKQVLDQLNVLKALCLVLGMDFKLTVCGVHPSLDDSCRAKSISMDTIESLSATIFRLKDVKLQRMRSLQDLAMTMVELWNLMDTPVEEQQMFQNVTCTIAAAESEITEPNRLSLEFINYDDNRYNAGRGTHLMLKRAEKARVVVNKIPAMVEALKSKAKAWEKERKVEFLYDGVGLVSMVDQYCELKHLKEQERQRQRDRKKLQGQLLAEQEAMYGSKPSPSKSGNKNLRPSTGGAANKRFSLGGAMLQNTLADKAALSSRSLLKNNPVKRQSSHNHSNSGFMAHSSATHQTHSMQNYCHCGRPLPLSSLSSNIISCNFQDQNIKSGDFQDTYIVCKTPAAAITPTKNVSTHDENRTPKTMPIPVPATPPTVSAAMQTATTPFTPAIRVAGEVEYSFEEKRAGFVLPRSHSKPLQLV
ncbi:UNVERIFIED_CONTAM: microtubule-associated protein 3 [Sesamum radiatum]|uniref:Microtubule-associated protein 3 n=1 Tax=Sesamum radiatum TaxID=300843 RepID=A0AAW2KRE9_SESRA